MQELIVVLCGDEWSAEADIPVEYESAEALYVHLEQAAVKYMETYDWNPPIDIDVDSVVTRIYNKDDAERLRGRYPIIEKEKNRLWLVCFVPEILHLDVWFERESKKYRKEHK